MRRMPQFRTNYWQAAKPWLQPAISEATGSADAMGIIPAGAEAYRRGRRNRLTRAAHVAMHRPYTQQAVKAMKYLADPRKVDPRAAIRTLKGYGAAPYWEFYKRMGHLPHIEQFQQVAPLLYGASESAAGRLIGPGGVAVPSNVWRGAARGARGALSRMPYQLGRAQKMFDAPQYANPLQMITQFLRGRGISLGEIAKEFLPSILRT